MSNLFSYIVMKFNDRYTILRLTVLLVGTILLGRLFYLQIVRGEEYREQSSKRLLREITIEPMRGEIYDRNGRIIASNELSFGIEMFKTNMSSEQMNDTILRLIRLLKVNNDKILDTFPVGTDAFLFDGDVEKEKSWKKANNIDESASVEQVIAFFKKKYKVKYDDKSEERDVIAVRYGIAQKGISVKRSYRLATGISRTSVAQIEENNLDFPGISIVVQPKRVYQYGAITSHLIGYVSKISDTELNDVKDQGYTQNSVIGKSGIEQMYEKYLKGEPGLKNVVVDSNGNIMSNENAVEAKAGNNLTLTIDIRLQQVASNALQRIIEESKVNEKTANLGIESGAVVALDVASGEVLAMASFPNFDPSLFIDGISLADWNKLNNDPNRPLYNRAIAGTYSPGSTFKMLTAIAGLETGAITPTSTITDYGVYPLSYHPTCWIYSGYGLTHGTINVSEALKVSCNYFFYEVGNRIGIDTLSNWGQKFGLGAKTGIDIQGEQAGTLSSPAMVKNNEWYLGDTLSSAIGQSYNSFTPIQLANYIATIANGGTKNRVYVTKGISDTSGNNISAEELISFVNKQTGVTTGAEKIEIKPENIAAVKEGMRLVTSQIGGTAYWAFKDLPMLVGGKTGTAQVTVGEPNGIFVGMAPFDDPKIAVACVIEHGGADSLTAKVVKEIIQEYYYTISGLAGSEDNIYNNSPQIQY